MTLVLAHGSFRIIHPGHIWHLREARAMGERLVVSITADKWIRKPGGPIFTEDDRADQLRELRCVDEVYICREQTGVTAIEHFRPQIYVKGIDYSHCGVRLAERFACWRVGADIRYTKTNKHGSGRLIAHV